MLSITLLCGKPVDSLHISSDPIDTTLPYDGEYITFENGTPLPIEGKEGIYQLKFEVSDLDTFLNPTLYIGPSPYPLRIYFDGELIYSWSHELSSFRMQTVRPFSAALHSGEKESGEITVMLFTDGQKIALPPFRIGSDTEIDDYVYIQDLVCSDGINTITMLSYLFGIMIILYFFLSGKRHHELLYVGLFAISEGVGYSIFIFDGPGMPQLFWLKLSRIAFPISMSFLYSSILRMVKSENRLLRKIEHLIYSLALVSGITVLLAPSLHAVTLVFNLSGLFIIYPIFFLIFIVLLKATFYKKRRNTRLIFIGFLAVIFTSGLDLFYLFNYVIPYAWFSAYGQFFLILTIIITIGIMEQSIHNQLVEAKNLLEESNYALKSANDSVERESTLRENFIKAVSHELRTPLNAVVGITHELSDKETPYFRQLTSSVNRLRLAITNIFTYQNLESDQGDVVLSEIDVLSICREILSFHMESALSKGLRLELREDRDYPVPSKVLGNSDCWELIVNNTLSNAVKFTDSGEVIVSISYHDDMLHYSVKDTGVGLSDTEITTLFSSFNSSTSHNSYTTTHNQIGIGLRITKKEVELLHGSVEIKNRAECGVEVLVMLPLKSVAAEKVEKTRVRGNKILIVEDNDINQLVLSKILMRAGYSSEIKVNGKEGLDEILVNGDKYSLILMDIQMPIMNGLEACRGIREAGIEIPVIALTANADRDECLKSGMNAYLSKPYSAKSVVEMVQTFI